MCKTKVYVWSFHLSILTQKSPKTHRNKQPKVWTYFWLKKLCKGKIVFFTMFFWLEFSGGPLTLCDTSFQNNASAWVTLLGGFMIAYLEDIREGVTTKDYPSGFKTVSSRAKILLLLELNYPWISRFHNFKMGYIRESLELNRNILFLLLP